MRNKSKKFFFDNIIVANVMGGVIYQLSLFLAIPFYYTYYYYGGNFWREFSSSLVCIIFWIITAGLLMTVKKDRVFLEKLRISKETIGEAVIGLMIGLGLGLVCFLVAYINRDIEITYRGENVFLVILIFLVAIIQAGAEEIVFRVYTYQHIKRGYRNRLLPFTNAVTYAAMSLINQEWTIQSVTSAFLFGILFSLMIYYFDSFWMAVFAHTGWSFLLNIVFGVPSSGQEVVFSIFVTEPNSAKSSFFFDVIGGIEGSYCCVGILLIAIIVLIICCENRRKKRYS